VARSKSGSGVAKLKPGTMLVRRVSWAGPGTMIILSASSQYYEVLINHPMRPDLQGVVQMWYSDEVHQMLDGFEVIDGEE
jgi:hypothetical protein